MIQRVRGLDHDTLRRGIGLLLVAAFVLLLVAGMVHVLDLDHDHGAAHECGVCVALAQIAVALPVLLFTVLRAGNPERHVLPGLVPAPRRRRAGGPLPARGPPVLR